MADEERRQRLAAALRENLKRRKAQDRGRREAGGAGASQAAEEPAGTPSAEAVEGSTDRMPKS
jgi:hypothetical protein